MSISAPDTLSLAGLTSTGLSPVSTLQIPANIQKDGSKATAAYAEGLEFEQVLVGQLTQQLANTVSGSDPSDSGTDADPDDPGSSSSDSSDATSGLLGAGSEYSSLIQQTLTTALMSGGGSSIAQEIATGIDPAINTAQTTATTSAAPTASTSATTSASGGAAI